MFKRKIKMLCMILTLIMALSSMPTAVFAVDEVADDMVATTEFVADEHEHDIST